MKTVGFLIITFLFNWLCLYAAESINLDQSIRIALANNPELRADTYSVEAAKWSERTAISHFLPRANFNASAVRIDDKTYEAANTIFQIPVFGPNNAPTGDYIPFSASGAGSLYKTSFRSGISIQQPVFMGGKITLGYQLARMSREQASLVLQNKKLDTSAKVASLYFSILKLMSLSELNDLSINSARSNLEKVEIMEETGMARRSDWLQWRFRLQDELSTKLEIENNLISLLEIWNILLGAKEIAYTPEPIPLDEYLSQIEEYSGMIDMTAFLVQTTNEVEKNNPQLSINRIFREMTKKQLLIAKGEFLPSLSMQFTYEFENDDKLDFSGNRSWNILAAFSFPLFTGGNNLSNLRRTSMEKQHAELMTQYSDDIIIIEAQQIARTLVSRAQSVESNRLALEFANENYLVMESLYDQGLITSIDFLDAETMLFAAKMNYNSSYYDFISTKYELFKYTGFQGDK